MPDDAELLGRYVDERSEAAFAALVARHLGLVYFAALRQVNGDAHRAKDVAQLVFVRLAAKARVLRGRASLAGWLYVTTRYEAAHSMRAERRRNARELEAQAMHDILAENEHSIDWDRLRPVVDEVLYGLNDRERELVLLRFFQGTPFAEIGARTGLSADAARFRLDRALEKMRVALAKRGLESTSAALALAFSSQAGAAVPAGLTAAIVGTALSSGVPAAGILHIMSTTKVIIGTAVVAGILGIGLSMREYSATRRYEAAIAAANRDLESISAQVLALKSEDESARRRLDALRAGTIIASSRPAAVAAGVPATQGVAPQAARVPSPIAMQPVNRELSNDPEIRAAFAGWMKGCFNVNYGPMFKSLNLSASQVEAFDDLMLDLNANMGTAVITLRPEGMTVPDVYKSIQSLLGDAGFQQFQHYQSTMYVGEVASGLAGSLYNTETPLTSQQAEQLTRIFAQNSNAPAGVPPFPGNIQWDAVLNQAQGVLSDPQLEVLRNVATVVSSQPGLWGSLNPISPGSVGRTATPPPAFYSIQASPK